MKKEELYRFKDFEAYKLALTREPQTGVLKSRSLGGGRTSTYIPVESVETTADLFFREWNVVDEKYMNVLNEIVCTVKIQALPDYPGADYETFTGSGSKPIQCAKNSKTELFPQGKLTNALEYCLPAVRSEAIVCAFETKGNIFGRNVNRNSSNGFGFDLTYKREENGSVQGNN